VRDLIFLQNLLGYSVEKCLEGSDKWEKCSGIFTQPKAVVKGLNEGQSYLFRVKAENIYGEGEPLETSKLIVVKPPYGKFKKKKFIFLFNFYQFLRCSRLSNSTRSNRFWF
jgi:hypothetical protein